MRSDRLNLRDLIRIIRHGLEQGAFSRRNLETLDAIRACISSKNLTTHKADGYEVDTYILPCPPHQNVSGLAVKVLPYTAETLIKNTSQECAILRQIIPRGGLYVVPAFLADFTYEDCRIFVTQLLPGKVATEVVLEEHHIVAIARAIRQLQSDISTTHVGRKKLKEVKGSQQIPYYALKIKKFLKETFSLQIGDGTLHVFGLLEAMRNQHPVIVSDRSPANFIIDQVGRVGAFDFGLILAGVPCEDWSWFIDDPRLQSALTREEILQIFCDYEQGSSGEDVNAAAFHVSAIFVCIKQYCLMRQIRRDEMAAHYLERALQSAEAISSHEVVQMLGELKNVRPAP